MREKVKIENDIGYIAKKKNLNDTQIAEESGLSNNTYVNKIKNGHINPSVTNAIKLARVLGVTVEDLWGSYIR